MNTRPSASAAARVTAAAAPAPDRTVRAPRTAQTSGPCNRPEDPQGAPLWLAYRPPYDLAGVGRFIGRRALPGLEQLAMPPASGAAAAPVWRLRRTLSLVHGGQRLAGWLAIEPRPERDRMRLVLSPELLPAAGAVLQRARQALDLDAEPHRIGQALAGLPGPPRPGLRAPGAWCGFESAVRIILGQQITVAAANTIALRLVALLGEPIGTPWPGLNRLFPTPEALATADAEAIGRLGIVRQRVRALQALARVVVDGSVVLDRSAPLAATQQALLALPGIGPWTVQLIAMRALAWPDAWLPTDIGVLNALGTRDPAEASAAVQACRPWRAYAVMHLWLSLANEVAPGEAAAAESDTDHADPGAETRPQSRQRRVAGQAKPSTPAAPAARPGVRHVRTP